MGLMGNYRSLCVFVGPNASFRILMRSHRSLRVLIGHYPFLCVFIGAYASLCVLMDPNWNL